MPVGVIVNVLAVFFGGLTGTFLGSKLRDDLKNGLQMMFSISALGMGINLTILMKNMPAVILSVLLGTLIGLSLHFGEWVVKAGTQMQKPAVKLLGNTAKGLSEEEFHGMLITIIVLFCASGTGIYGCIESGMTGDHTILISKAILDYFTAMIFACSMGAVVSVIAIPQFVIFMILFIMARFIYPLTTPDMICDFKACGGLLLLATGFRLIKVKELQFPTADMIPAMILVMPISYIWSAYITPMLVK